MDEQIHGACIDKKCHLKSSKFTAKFHEEDTGILFFCQVIIPTDKKKSKPPIKSASYRVLKLRSYNLFMNLKELYSYY